MSPDLCIDSLHFVSGWWIDALKHRAECVELKPLEKCRT